MLHSQHMLSGEERKEVYEAAYQQTSLHRDLTDFGGEAMRRRLNERPCRTRAESQMSTWLARRRDKKRRIDEKWNFSIDRGGGSGAESPASLTESETESPASFTESETQEEVVEVPPEGEDTEGAENEVSLKLRIFKFQACRLPPHMPRL